MHKVAKKMGIVKKDKRAALELRKNYLRIRAIAE